MKAEDKSAILVILLISHGFLATFSEAASASLARDKRSTGNANDYIDAVLVNLRQEIVRSKNDPITLPNRNSGFSKKLLFVRISGGANFFNGKAHGLSSIARYGPATLTEKHGTISIATTLRVSRITAYYDYKAWFKPIRVKGKAHGTVDDVRAAIKVSITPGSKPKLERFNLHLGKLNFDISGLGPITWVLSKLTSMLSNTFRKLITFRIEVPVRRALEKVLAKSNFVYPGK